MPSEPAWSKKISNTTVCTWFYILAVVNGLFAVAGVLSALFLMTKGGKNSFGNMFLVLVAALVGFTNAWFLYLVCNRGLHEGFADNKHMMKMMKMMH
jgi:hypothetical protein